MIITYIFSIHFIALFSMQAPNTSLTAAPDMQTVKVFLKNPSVLPMKKKIIIYRPDRVGNYATTRFFFPGQKKCFDLPIGSKVYIASKRQVTQVMGGNPIDNEEPFLEIEKDSNQKVFKIRSSVKKDLRE